MEPQALHLHTYFMFPFSVDKEAVMQDHQKVWGGIDHWIDGVDSWIDDHAQAAASPMASEVGRWQRSALRRFDMESFAYQDMVFFHPFVRRVFFDVGDAFKADGEGETLVRVYSIPLTPLQETGRRLILEAKCSRGKEAAVEITDLRLFMFANGIGILTIGIDATHIPVSRALWINEMMRKVYPSSGRQIREGRTPAVTTIKLVGGGADETVLEEKWEQARLQGYQPPLSKIITGLLYFANYKEQELEPVLDERMLIYSYLSVDPASVEQNYEQSEDYEILMSRFLYVDHFGDEYRYDADFTREEMKRNVYRRWAHQGTLYGFTSYSNVTLAMGRFDCDNHQLKEGFLVHRMFMSRYYFTLMVALFYRATLLEFSERTALVSGLLYKRANQGQVTEADIRLVWRLMAEFQHFSNYWYFSELANKDEEIEHFQMQCEAFRLSPIKTEVEEEIKSMNTYLGRLSDTRSTDSINRLAMLSMIFGGGAVITGFFGMNFGKAFGEWFFEPKGPTWLHWLAVIGVTATVAGALGFAAVLVVTNWTDYRKILIPSARKESLMSLRRTKEFEESEEE